MRRPHPAGSPSKQPRASGWKHTFGTNASCNLRKRERGGGPFRFGEPSPALFAESQHALEILLASSCAETHRGPNSRPKAPWLAAVQSGPAAP